MSRHLAGLLTAVVAAGCSAGPVTSGNGVSSFTPETLLTLVGFTKGTFNQAKRFAGYTKAAKRVSLINPDTESEAWGVEFEGGYDLATPLPNYLGLAVLSGQSFFLLAQDGSQQHFKDIEFPIGFVQEAQTSTQTGAASVIVSKDGQHLHVIRQHKDQSWEEQTFDQPWEDIGKYSAPPDGQPPLGIAMISNSDVDNSTHIVYVQPADGRYAYYEGQENANMALVGEPCNGDGQGTPTNATYRAMALDDGLGVVYAGDLKGRLTAFPQKGSCQQPAQRPGIDLGDGSPITDIDVLGNKGLLVTQAGGQVHAVSFDGKSFTIQASYTSVCPYPLGALPAGARLAVTCYTPKNFDPAADAKTAPAVIQYSGAFVQIYDPSTRQDVLQIPVDVDKAAGMAIDGDQNKILTLEDDALGVLDVVSLIDGSYTQKKGLFLAGILH